MAGNPVARRVLFLRTRGGEDPVTCLWRLDLADGGGGRERLVADPAASWNSGPGDVPEAERVRRERARERAAGIVAYSADGTARLLAARVDNSPVQRWWIADPADPERPPRAVRYAAAGTANADVTLHVLRLDGSRTEVTWDRGAHEYVTAAEWDSQGPLLSVQSRDQRTVRSVYEKASFRFAFGCSGCQGQLFRMRAFCWSNSAWVSTPADSSSPSCFSWASRSLMSAGCAVGAGACGAGTGSA